MSKQRELVQRWDTFLSNMKTRFNETLEQGREAVLSSLEGNDYDYTGSIRVLHSVQSQIRESIIAKIDDTWAWKVEPEMKKDGDYWIDEHLKAYDVRERMNDELHIWQITTEGLLSQKFYNYAIQLVNKKFFCSQCHSPVEIRHDFFRAHYVTCNYCNTVNIFEPETTYVQIGWNVVDNIARLNALESYKEYLVADTLYRTADSRKQEDHSSILQQRKNAYWQYLENYFTERIKLLPHSAETYQQDIQKEFNNYFG